MANLKTVQAALERKQADLDMMDDQLLEMDSNLPPDMSSSPEFDLLAEKREELEEEIHNMREGVQLIGEWEKFKGGPWSEDIKQLLSEIDIEITDIAGGEVAPGSALPGMEGDLGGGADMGMMPPPSPVAPESAPPVSEPVHPAAPTTPPEAGAPPLEPPMAASKNSTSKKINYQSLEERGNFAHLNSKKEGNYMATPTQATASVNQKLADTKIRREAIRKEAQQRVAAAWTIAKTMLPTAPAEVQKSAAATLLQNTTPVLNAMLRQTAKNSHYTKQAEEVHKKEMNDLLPPSSELTSEQRAVAAELKGEPKNAGGRRITDKVADDRKESGPQPETYNDGRGCGGGKHTEPKEMDAGSTSSQTEPQNRPDNTINKSDGDKKASKTAKCDCEEGKCKCGATEKAAAKCEKCKGPCKCDNKKEAAHKPDCSCNFCKNTGKSKDKKDKKEATTKKAAPPVMDAPPTDDVPPMDGEAPVEEAPMDVPPEDEAMEEAPMDMPPTEEGADTPGEVLSDEKKMVVEEKIEEAQEAIQALEQEILSEGDEELDLSKMNEGPEEVGPEGEELDMSGIFNEDGSATEEMEEKVSALANEDDEHTAGNGEEYFAPSAAETMEASLDEPQMASMDDFFSLRGSDSDPLAHLIAGEIRTAADVAGMTVIPTSTGELANKMETDTAKGESRDNESDHEGDIFAEAIEDQKPEDGGFKRVKQDETNELKLPTKSKESSAKTPVIKKLKAVTASAPKPMNIASALFGDDDF